MDRSRPEPFSVVRAPRSLTRPLPLHPRHREFAGRSNCYFRDIRRVDSPSNQNPVARVAAILRYQLDLLQGAIAPGPLPRGALADRQALLADLGAHMPSLESESPAGAGLAFTLSMSDSDLENSDKILKTQIRKCLNCDSLPVETRVYLAVFLQRVIQRPLNSARQTGFCSDQVSSASGTL